MSATFIMFFGPPGCGKGTQAKKVAQEFSLVHLSTGELFRKHLSEQTLLGLQAQEFMSKGELVPDEITIGMVHDRLQQPDAQKGAIFDGFPRTGDQAAALDSLLNDMNGELAMVIEFVLPIEVSRERLMARQEGRADDQPEVIEKRLQDHAAVEASVMPHYRSQADLIEQIDATGTIDEVYDRVKSLVQQALA